MRSCFVESGVLEGLEQKSTHPVARSGGTMLKLTATKKYNKAIPSFSESGIKEATVEVGSLHTSLNTYTPQISSEQTIVLVSRLGHLLCS